MRTVAKKVEVRKKRVKPNNAHRLKDKNLKPVRVDVVIFEGKVELQFDRATRRVPMDDLMALMVAEKLRDTVEELLIGRKPTIVQAEIGEVEEDEDELGEVL